MLNYKREAEKEEEKRTTESSYSQARESEEVVVSEPIYTMVIKSPKVMKAVDWEPNQSESTNGDSIPLTEQADKIEVVKSCMMEVEPEMERDAGDGQTESPVMWEYKLPAPPTPFQDSGDSPLDKLQTATVGESNRSRRSSMSTDSLQHGSGDEDEIEKDSLRSSIVCPELEFKEDGGPVSVQLEHGVELLEETRTEEQPLDIPVISGAEEKTSAVVKEEEKVVVLKSSDPEAKQYGIESTTDEPLSLQQEVSLPPVPSTMPPSDSEDDSLQSEMRFSIATYNLRVSKDSSYEKKLRSISPETLPVTSTASPIGI